jgi:hypothetical protein
LDDHFGHGESGDVTESSLTLVLHSACLLLREVGLCIDADARNIDDVFERESPSVCWFSGRKRWESSSVRRSCSYMASWIIVAGVPNNPPATSRYS